MKYKNLSLIGTSHIARQSIQEVRAAINDKVEIVAVELDTNRLQAMLRNEKNKFSFSDIKHIGFTGFIFAVIGSWTQKKLGKFVGIMPGSDMLAAVREAKKKKKQLFLIDQNVAITLKRLTEAITWKEKLRFPLDIIKAILFKKKEMERLGVKDLDLTKVPSKELIKKLTEDLKKKYPNVHRVLIAERNRIMAKRLSALMQQFPDKEIVAVVGAGHEEDILDLIKKYKEEQISYEFTVGHM